MKFLLPVLLCGRLLQIYVIRLQYLVYIQAIRSIICGKTYF